MAGMRSTALGARSARGDTGSKRSAQSVRLRHRSGSLVDMSLGSVAAGIFLRDDLERLLVFVVLDELRLAPIVEGGLVSAFVTFERSSKLIQGGV